MKSPTALPQAPSYLDRYVAIRDRKKRATRTPLIAAHALITRCYEDYSQAIAPGALAGLVGNAQAAQLSGPLRACHDSPTRPLEELKQAIRDAQLKRLLKYCPMCGTTLPRTFDQLHENAVLHGVGATFSVQRPTGPSDDASITRLVGAMTPG